MKKFFLLTAPMFFVCSLFLTDLARGDAPVLETANKEGKVTVYTARSIEILHGFAKEFNRTYPKIKVDVYRAGTYQVVQKFMSESQAGKQICDVYWGSGGLEVWEDFMKKEYIMKYNSPNYQYYDSKDKHDGYWIDVNPAYVAPVYNTNYVKKGEIKSYKDILNPKYKGKVGIADPSQTTSAFSQFWVVYNNPQLGESFLRELSKQNVKIYSGMGPAHEAVLSGEVWISLVMNTYRALEGKFNDNDPIEVLWPEEGTIERRSPVGIPAKASHPNAAKVLFDWITSKEGQTVIQPSFFFSNHKEVPSYKGVERVKKFMEYSETEMANADKRKYFDIFERIFHKK